MSVKIKICGITNAADAIAVERFGSDFIGLIFEPKSPRCVTLQSASAICKSVGSRVKTVGVFVNQSADFILRAADECGLFAIQLHGGQDEAFAQKVKESGCEIWKVAWLETPEDLQRAADFPCDKIVADSRSKTAVGGTGVIADWSTAKLLAAKKRLVLAGGISADNALEAVKFVEPWAIDANSKVEISPRKKDLEKIKTLIEKIKNLK